MFHKRGYKSVLRESILSFKLENIALGAGNLNREIQDHAVCNLKKKCKISQLMIPLQLFVKRGYAEEDKVYSKVLGFKQVKSVKCIAI